MNDLKRCPRCSTWKERSDTEFFRSKHTRDGLTGWCKVCATAHTQAYQAAHSEEIKQYRREYRASHREARIEEKRQYRARNRERLLESERERQRQRREQAQAARPPKPAPPPKPPKPQRQKPAPIPLGTEFEKHLKFYLNAKSAAIEDYTLNSYEKNLKMFGRWLGEKWPFDADDINGFLAAAKRRGCSDTAVHNYYRSLRNFSYWLVKRGKLQENPILMAEKPPKPQKLPRVPKAEDIKRLLDYLAGKRDTWQGQRDNALIVLALDTGLRIGELVKLTLTDLDLEKRRILIRLTKTDRERFVVLSPHCVQALGDWLKVRPQRESDRLFLSQIVKGTLTVSGASRFLRDAIKRAGAGHFTMHRLRHAYAVYSLRNGANLLDVQKQLGHTNIETTARYLLITDDDQRVERHAQHSALSFVQGGAA